MDVIYAVKSALELFKQKLGESRILVGDDSDASYLLHLKRSIQFDLNQTLPEKRYEEDDVVWIKTQGAYARTGGNDLEDVQSIMNNPLPGDFLEFYREIREGLLITLSHPIHFWSEEKMIGEMQAMRDDFNGPIRFLRFGDYYHLEGTQFALWKPRSSSGGWHVVTTSHERRDDFYDAAIDERPDAVHVYGEGFTSWMNLLIESDGVNDPLCRRYDLESIFTPG